VARLKVNHDVDKAATTSDQHSGETFSLSRADASSVMTSGKIITSAAISQPAYV